jgi:AraC-like DNA-binding protein
MERHQIVLNPSAARATAWGGLNAVDPRAPAFNPGWSGRDRQQRLHSAWPHFARVARSSEDAESIACPPHSFGSAFCGSEQLKPPVGSGHRHYFAFSDSFLGMAAKVRYSTDVSTIVPGDDFVKFHFKISGNNTIRFAGEPDVTLRGGSAAIVIHPRGVTNVDAHARDALEHSITFACSQSVLTEKLRLDSDALPEPIRAFVRGLGARPHLRIIPLKPRMTRTIAEMLTSPYSSRFSHIHAEARALDLICMALDTLLNEVDSGNVRLTPRDAAALDEVRRALDLRFMDPPTIVEIAREAGMNRTKVTQGFRYLFNETILDYCQRLRMQRARELLLTGAPVGRVAADVGYEHHSSFAHAFRSYFGYAPVEMRRSRPAR